MPGYELFDENESNAVAEIFTKQNGVLFAHGFDSLRNGSFKVREYEKKFADKLGFKYGQAVSSGTAALKIGLQSLGIKPGDEVITQCHTFVATVEAILSVGAIPKIINIDKSLNMDSSDLEKNISRKTKAIIPVHMLGEMSNMEDISLIAKKNHIPILEDCSQALGASINNKIAGSYSDIAAYSTDAGKTINTGEGGMLLTNSRKIYELARSYHDHGHKYVENLARGKDLANVIGFNYRMTELQAVIGIVQLSKLELILESQRKNKLRFISNLEDFDLEFRTSFCKSGDISDTIVFFADSEIHANKIVANLQRQNIGTKNLPDALNWHFSLNWQHLFKTNRAYMKHARKIRDSEKLLKRSIALPVNINLSIERIDQISEIISNSIKV